MAEFAQCPVCHAELEPGVSMCARCGFKLVGQTEQFPHIETDENGVGVAPTVKSVGTPTLTVLKGPYEGEVFRLTSFPLIIGRDPKCDLFLNNMTVTRKHASLDVSDNEVILGDLGSLNGVWVDGEIKERAVLKDGTIVQIGTFTMAFNV